MLQLNFFIFSHCSCQDYSCRSYKILSFPFLFCRFPNQNHHRKVTLSILGQKSLTSFSIDLGNPLLMLSTHIDGDHKPLEMFDRTKAIFTRFSFSKLIDCIRFLLVHNINIRNCKFFEPNSKFSTKLTKIKNPFNLLFLGPTCYF